VSSPYKRSYETILPAATLLKKSIATDERLRERKAGINGNNREFFRKRWEDKSFSEPDGECIASVQKRNIAALSDILKRDEGKTVVIGTHGTALSSILNFYNPGFGCDDYLRIINFMPYVIEMTFDGTAYLWMEEKVIIEKRFKG